MPYSSSLTIWQRLFEKKGRLDALHPLREVSIHSLMSALDVELVYSSNAIEGNTMTLAETTVVLDYGVTIGGSRSKITWKSCSSPPHGSE